ATRLPAPPGARPGSGKPWRSRMSVDRRAFLQHTAATAAALAVPKYLYPQQSDLAPIFAQIEKRHAEAVARLQQWIRQPSIAAEHRGVNEGCDLTMQLLRDAGFDQVTKIPTDGQPGIFATPDAGAPRTLGLYFVLVAGGEEEIGSPHFPQSVRRPEVQSALSRTLGIFMPSAAQGSDGRVTITLGAKGVIECELVSSGERWGRGPRKDIHSSNKARVDSPAWHLVEALATLVSPDGNEPAIEGYADKARPLSAGEKAMVAEAARRLDEAVVKRELGVDHWVHDVSWVEALERLVSRPTVNIEGLVGGYTGPGGKTILPHRAVAKLDLRLVPDMTATESLAALK